jgi:hypothetical protein
MRDAVYVSVDVEADGPIPGVYSMVSLGAAVAGRHGVDGFVGSDPVAATFYVELAPISDEWVPEALAVSGLDRDRLVAEGTPAAEAMAAFTGWIGEVSGDARPVFTAYPASFDWMFVYWYLIRFTGHSPFGHSGCLDLKTLYAARAGVPLTQAVKGRMPRELLSDRPHTHHALDDAVEQADLAANLLRWEGPRPR